MEKIETTGLSWFKAVSASFLESETKKGWKLVGVVSEQQPHIAMDQQAVFNPQHNYIQSHPVQHTIPVTVLHFILGYEENKVIEDFQKEVASLTEQVKALPEKEKVIEHLKKELTQVQGVRDANGQELNATRTRVNEGRIQVMKMEADIAKIRKAVGELRMKEILEAT